MQEAITTTSASMLGVRLDGLLVNGVDEDGAYFVHITRSAVPSEREGFSVWMKVTRYRYVSQV